MVENRHGNKRYCNREHEAKRFLQIRGVKISRDDAFVRRCTRVLRKYDTFIIGSAFLIIARG